MLRGDFTTLFITAIVALVAAPANAYYPFEIDFPHAGMRLANVSLIPGDFSPRTNATVSCIIYERASGPSELPYNIGAYWEGAQSPFVAGEERIIPPHVRKMSMPALAKMLCNAQCNGFTRAGTSWMSLMYDCVRAPELGQCVLVQKIASTDVLPASCELRDTYPRDDTLPSHVKQREVLARVPRVMWSEGPPKILRTPLFAQMCVTSSVKTFSTLSDVSGHRAFVLPPRVKECSTPICRDPLYTCIQEIGKSCRVGILGIEWQDNNIRPSHIGARPLPVGARCRARPQNEEGLMSFIEMNVAWGLGKSSTEADSVIFRSLDQVKEGVPFTGTAENDDDADEDDGDGDSGDDSGL